MKNKILKGAQDRPTVVKKSLVFDDNIRASDCS